MIWIDARRCTRKDGSIAAARHDAADPVGAGAPGATDIGPLDGGHQQTGFERLSREFHGLAKALRPAAEFFRWMT